jgi:hypothetical protein
MKRYLLFAGEIYYPIGGWDDLKGSFETIDEAKAAASGDPPHKYEFDWWHVIDAVTGEKVLERTET